MTWAKKQTGFTIVELLIVVVVIAILAAITIVSYNGITSRANVSKSVSDLRGMQKLIEMYKVDKGSYPLTSGWRYTNYALPNGGDNFIPGLVPEYAPSLPRPAAGAYIYNSNGTDYKVMRYGSIPAGEWAVASSQLTIDGAGTSNSDRYGFWSPGGVGF